jgi:hypothetical protein
MLRSFGGSEDVRKLALDAGIDTLDKISRSEEKIVG